MDHADRSRRRAGGSRCTRAGTTDDALHLEGTVIAGGGATLEGGTFRVNGTVGQPATHVLTGASLRLYDGFWSPAASASDVIFSNGFDP